MNAVQKEIDGGEAGGEERPPPPVVVLGAEMKVGEEDGGLGTSDDENDEDEKEKAEHVVGLVGPDTIENEEELNEDATEGQNAAHDDSWDGTRIDGLVGNLSRDLVRPNGMLDRAFLESKVGADEGQRDGHADPQRQQTNLSNNEVGYLFSKRDSSDLAR